MNYVNRFNKNFGFSLIELSFVIVIIGMMMAAGLKYLAAQSENAVYSTTLKRQETIKLALVSHLRTHKYLPCPDTRPGDGDTGTFSTTNIPDGTENRKSATSSPVPTATCDANFGIVPFQELGLSRDVALDGWENYMSYNVSYPASGDANDWVRPAKFNSANNGSLTINDRYPPTSASTTTKSENAVVVIISHGKNGLGAYTIKGTRNVLPANTSDEYQNTVGTGNRFSRELLEDTSSTYGVFDDLVTYLTPNDILDPLFREGSISSPEAELAKEMVKITNIIVGYVMKNDNCTTPISLAAAGVTGDLLTDPWGKTYVYSENLRQIREGGRATDNDGDGVNVATHTAFTLTSQGPDKRASADDTSVTMTPLDLIFTIGGNYTNNFCP